MKILSNKTRNFNKILESNNPKIKKIIEITKDHNLISLLFIKG